MSRHDKLKYIHNLQLGLNSNHLMANHQPMENSMLSLHPITRLLIIPQSDGSIKWKALKTKKLLGIHSNNQIKVHSQPIPQLILHESKCREHKFVLHTLQNNHNCQFNKFQVLRQLVFQNLLACKHLHIQIVRLRGRCMAIVALNCIVTTNVKTC